MSTKNFTEKASNLKKYSKKRKYEENINQLECIVHYSSNDKDKVVKNLTNYSFKIIQEKKNIRQNSIKPNDRLDGICNNIPVSFDSTLHGFHSWCYKNFTNVSRIVKEKNNVTKQPSTLREKRIKVKDINSYLSPLFSNKVCLICGKYKKKVKPYNRISN